ncbi:MAG: hypothetical protein KC609_20430 [Myxococcales bacterium]|nr:hypothetical protein [Myxococcales bacterium]
MRYRDLPLPPSAYGAELYRRGWALVQQSGLRLAQLMFDADEVLWDWVMSFDHVIRHIPRFLLRRDLGHREYIRSKAGIFELIWGMHHASLELGLDPHLRIWTNGYPWRIWKISTFVPGLDQLLGPPASTSEGPESFFGHPRLFSRPDYAAAVLPLVDFRDRGSALRDLSPAVASLIERHLAHKPHDSSLKVPELAFGHKQSAFDDAAILVDDRPQNVARLAQTGRRGVVVHSETPTLVFGRLKNVVWRDPFRHLRRSSVDSARNLAAALEMLATGRGGQMIAVRGEHEIPDYPAIEFTIDVPDAILRRQWVAPARSVKDAFRTAPQRFGSL